MGKMKTILVMLVIAGLLYLAWVKFPSSNLNERFDEHRRPTGKATTIPTVAVGFIMGGGLLLAASIATHLTGGKSGGN